MQGSTVRTRGHASSIITNAVVALGVSLPQAAVGQLCAGDCDGNGAVSVNEIVVGVNVLLGASQVAACPPVDSNGDGNVTVNELIAAINNLLCGCMPCPTQPPTRTPTRTGTPSPRPTGTPPSPVATVFFEGWESARAGVYRPRANSPLGGDVIAADTGDWVVGDTVTRFDDCGESPHFVEIANEDSSRRLRLHSGNSDSDCADNVDVAAIRRNPPMLRGIDVDLSDDIYLAFDEHGALDGTDNCDAVFFTLEFDQAYTLNYALQRGPGWESRGFGCGSILTRDVILLDPAANTYVRNVLADAEEAGFERPDRITFIGFSVDSHGTATFDDVRFFRAREP